MANTNSTTLIRNVLIAILSAVIAVVLFLWKVLTGYQQPSSEADQYQNGDK